MTSDADHRISTEATHPLVAVSRKIPHALGFTGKLKAASVADFLGVWALRDSESKRM
jgi:hypothetical protein